MGIKIVVKAQRDPKHWHINIKKGIKIPSRWPKGQTVLDRLYWIDAALLNCTGLLGGVLWLTDKRIRYHARVERTRLNGLYDQAIALS